MARNILKSMATVSGLTLLSRLLGFARQLRLAGLVGASGTPVGDAFNVAFRLRNLCRRLLAEGAFQAAFVPLFQGKTVNDDMGEAKRFAEDVLAWLIVILTALSAAAMIFTPLFVSVLATGFRDDAERFTLTVEYTRIMFPYLACMSMVGIYGGMLNALHRFAAAAAAPLLLNIVWIAGLLALAHRPEEEIGRAAAGAVMAGGVLQLIMLLIAGYRSKLLLRLRLPHLTQGVKRLILLGTPGFIAAGALQINLIVGTNVASRQAGANSWLAYADQLYQLPLSMIGIALGIVLMPAISRSVKSGNEKGAIRTLSRGIEVALFFALPAAAALIVIPDRVCAALFQDLAGDVTRLIGAGRSAFNDHDVEMTGLAIMLFGIGLPAFVLQKVLNAAYFAREDTKTPMKFALTGIALNAIVSISLFPVIGFLSVPLGTICASWTEVTLLSFTLARRGHLAPGAKFLTSTIRVILAAALLGALLYGCKLEWEMLRGFALGQDWLLLIVLVGISVVLYAGITVLIGGVDPREWRGGGPAPAQSTE